MNSRGATIFMGTFLLGSLAWAADKPVTLSGTWVLDKTEQNFSPTLGGSGEDGGGGYPGRSGGGYPGSGGGGFPGGGGGYPGGFPGGGMPGGGGYPGGGGGGRRGSGGYPGGPGSRSPGASVPAEITDLTLAITQSPTEVKIERKWTRDGNERSVVQTFALDGSENRNPDDTGRGEVSSKTKWHKSTLVTEGSQQTSAGNGDVEMQVKQEFSLSKDGKVLTVKTTRQTPTGQLSIKQFFHKS